MSENRASYPIERRGIGGTDLYTEISALSENFLRDSKNLTIENGVVKTRPGSTRYGTGTFAGCGTPHGIHFFSTVQGEWMLAHCGTKLWVVLSTGGAAVAIQDLAAVDIAVPNADHPSRRPFVPIGMEYDASGTRIFKFLFRNKAGCKVLEYREDTGAWVGRNPSISSGTSYFAPGTAVGTSCEPGFYRIRVVPARIVNGVRVAEGTCFGRDVNLTDKEYQQVEITAYGFKAVILITHGGLGADLTHWIVESTRVLQLSAGTNYSSNGNDPNLFFEVAVLAKAAGAFTFADIILSGLSVTKPNTFGFLPFPGHEISTFSAGILFFTTQATVQSRIFAAGADGFATHAEIYDPSLFVPADEADGKAITDLELIGNHLGVWKENKTGVLLSRDITTEVVWRDRKIGAPAQGCISMLTEQQAVVLCHDGQLRVFDGNSYDHALELGNGSAPISEPMRTITETLVPGSTAEVSFVWHKEKLHLLYTAGGVRKGLQLLPRYGYAWMPWEWTEASHRINALAENDTRWIFLASTGLAYEQSPAAAQALDRGTIAVPWRRRDAPIWPRNRRNILHFERIFVEGIFDLLTQVTLVLGEGQATTATVGAVPDTGVPASTYQRWYQLYPSAGVELKGPCLEIILEGVGASTQRAIALDVQEEASFGVPSKPASRQDLFAYLPTWAAPMVVYIRFDSADSTTQIDFSGNTRNLIWQGGGGSTYITRAAMAPYGGVEASAGANNGFLAATWDGMDYIGDNAGANSAPQTWEVVFYRPGAGDTYIERAVRIATGEAWLLIVKADGTIRINQYVSARSFQWISAAGIVPASGSAAAPYVLQLTVFDTGNQLRLWCGPASGVLTEIEMTRSVTAPLAFALPWNIGYFSAIGISHFRRLKRMRDDREARDFHNLIKSLL